MLSSECSCALHRPMAHLEAAAEVSDVKESEPDDVVKVIKPILKFDQHMDSC